MTEDVDNAGTAAKARSEPTTQGRAENMFSMASAPFFALGRGTPRGSVPAQTGLGVKPRVTLQCCVSEARLNARVLPTIRHAKRRYDPPHARAHFIAAYLKN